MLEVDLDMSSDSKTLSYSVLKLARFLFGSIFNRFNGSTSSSINEVCFDLFVHKSFHLTVLDVFPGMLFLEYFEWIHPQYQYQQIDQNYPAKIWLGQMTPDFLVEWVMSYHFLSSTLKPQPSQFVSPMQYVMLYFALSGTI